MAATDDMKKLMAEVEALRMANAGLASQLEAKSKTGTNALTISTGEKGGVVVGGLGRFPITLYANQWVRFLDPVFLDKLRKYIDDNKAALSWSRTPGKAPATPAATTESTAPDTMDEQFKAFMALMAAKAKA